MRQFVPKYFTEIKIKKVVHKTPKAYLFLLKEPKVSIWVPKYWVEEVGKTFFSIPNKYESEIRLKIYAELDSQKNTKDE